MLQIGIIRTKFQTLFLTLPLEFNLKKLVVVERSASEKKLTMIVKKKKRMSRTELISEQQFEAQKGILCVSYFFFFSSVYNKKGIKKIN